MQHNDLNDDEIIPHYGLTKGQLREMPPLEQFKRDVLIFEASKNHLEREAAKGDQKAINLLKVYGSYLAFIENSDLMKIKPEEMPPISFLCHGKRLHFVLPYQFKPHELYMLFGDALYARLAASHDIQVNEAGEPVEALLSPKKIKDVALITANACRSRHYGADFGFHTPTKHSFEDGRHGHGYWFFGNNSLLMGIEGSKPGESDHINNIPHDARAISPEFSPFGGTKFFNDKRFNKIFAGENGNPDDIDFSKLLRVILTKEQFIKVLDGCSLSDDQRTALNDKMMKQDLASSRQKSPEPNRATSPRHRSASTPLATLASKHAALGGKNISFLQSVNTNISSQVTTPIKPNKPLPLPPSTDEIITATETATVEILSPKSRMLSRQTGQRLFTSIQPNLEDNSLFQDPKSDFKNK